MFKDKKNLKLIWISLLGLIFFMLDRVLKYLAVNGKIFFVKNSGVAFSINIPEILLIYFYIFIFLIFIILIWKLIEAYKNKKWLPVTGYQLLILGVASNFIDRIKFGYIIDYIDFYFFYNNLADVMIVVGVIMLAISFVNKK